MPTIKGLTTKQVELLDKMWACDTYDEYTEFLDTLTPKQRKEAERLQTLLLIETLDEDMEQETQYPDARRVLLDIMAL